MKQQPRLEDWPVMPTEKCGFHLKPVGFFDSSNIMDLPSYQKSGSSSVVVTTNDIVNDELKVISNKCCGN